MRPRTVLTRLVSMGPAELSFRASALLRNTRDRTVIRFRGSRWSRRDLARVLAGTEATQAAREAAAEGDFDAAHQHLLAWLEAHPGLHFANGRARDRISTIVLNRIRPDLEAVRDEAERLRRGEYDVLGFRRLVYNADGSPDGSVDWHLDPVHRRRMPLVFWTDVPYLDPAVGDHKIVWEVNRHQQLPRLARAAWLTGDRRYSTAVVDLFESWLAANPPLVGGNWASMLELAFRALSWTWAARLITADAVRPETASPWLVDLLVALDRHLYQIERHRSTWFSPNTHLLGEALALYVCGTAWPILRHAARWRALGRRILLEEPARQVLPDGGYAERSPYYHRYALDTYVLALATARATDPDVAPAFERNVARLAAFARVIADDRGRLPHIGDDDGGKLAPICPRDGFDVRDTLAACAALLGDDSLRVDDEPVEESVWLFGGHDALAPALERALAALPQGRMAAAAAFPDTGYLVARHGGDHLVFDVGPHGYLNAGHAHADALGVVLTTGGRPLFIDPGTGTYTADPALRDRLRSSRFHNTVTIDGESQSIARGPFHWARTADAVPLDEWHAPGFHAMAGAHDAYRPIDHARLVIALPEGEWLFLDLITGDGTHAIEQHWHVHPRWQVTPVSNGCTLADRGHADPAGVALAFSEPVVERFSGEPGGLGWMSPAFGALVPATTLRVAVRRALPAALATFVGHGTARPVPRIAVELGSTPTSAQRGPTRPPVVIRLEAAGWRESILARLDPASGTIDAAPFETDARLACVRELGDGRRRIVLASATAIAFPAGPLARIRFPRPVRTAVVDAATGTWSVRADPPIDGVAEWRAEEGAIESAPHDGSAPAAESVTVA